ncbi:retrotransposon hot spot (RHS) protein [Trypanosoma cruzi]|nr:retrotransposon hot spot (RHS) protein [Trypanosoma cruzi]
MTHTIENNSDRRKLGREWGFLASGEKHWVIFICYFDCVYTRHNWRIARYEGIIVFGAVAVLQHVPFSSIAFEGPSITEAFLRDGRRIRSIGEMAHSVWLHGVRRRVMDG